MPDPSKTSKPEAQRLPILVRHAVSLSVVFALALVLSYFAAHVIHQRLQLKKLNSPEQATFNEGLAYVLKHAVESDAVHKDALYAVSDLTDTQRAADLLLAIAMSHANSDNAQPIIPVDVTEAIAPLMQRIEPRQAIGLYDGLIQIKGINPLHAAEELLASINPKDDAELLQVVDLLDTRLLWSSQWVPVDLWIRWLVVLADSDAELTQANTAKRLGALPDSVDDPRVIAGLSKLSQSKYETVRAMALAASAGYAAIAKDPTDYEQIIFQLGSDPNKIIARRAWMIVGHLNPLSGFAVNWQDADPFVAEAMLWAAVKTNPENPLPAWQAFDAEATRTVSLQALALLHDEASIGRLNTVIDSKPAEQIQIDPERLIDQLTNASDLPPYVLPIGCVSLLSDVSDVLAMTNRLLRMSQTQARVLGALVTGIAKVRPRLISGITSTLLREHPNLSNEQLREMPDAQLADLGLVRVDALTALLEAAEAAPPSAGRAGEAKLLRLALWMRGDLGEGFTPNAEAMLFDDELSTSTVLMCLLHMQRPIALDYLFGDLITPRPDLHKLFIQERYWHVFRRFVDTTDLTLWLWGDPEAQGFQLEAMRQWYAVNRWRIERGWWPKPGASE